MGRLLKTLYPTHKPSDFDADTEELKTNLRQRGRFAALKGLGFAPKPMLERRLNVVKTPALVAMDTKVPDWPAPAVEARFVAEESSAELILIKDACHYPQTEMPEQVAPAILDFLARVPAPVTSA